ncbi:hypothetical protein S245_063320, partial [Arachis hypogaea]
DVMLCGGSDAAIIPIGLGGFVACKALSQRNTDPTKALHPWDIEIQQKSCSFLLLLTMFLTEMDLSWGRSWSFTFGRLGACKVHAGRDNLIALGVDASRKALEMANVDPDDLDLILMCTSTLEDLFGSAPQIQKQLGCKANPLAYDITAACSGFVLGLISTACHIRVVDFVMFLLLGLMLCQDMLIGAIEGVVFSLGMRLVLC